MRLNLRKIIPAPGASIPFDFQMDLSDLEWNGERPAAHPIHVSGTVRNMAGALLLEGEADTVLELRCDRCHGYQASLLRGLQRPLRQMRREPQQRPLRVQARG